MPDKFTTKGFADYFVESRGYTNTFLDKIDRLVDWTHVEKVLLKKYKKTASADGRPAYPPLPMFKLLMLQRWYGLSDPAAEEALKDRISFHRVFPLKPLTGSQHHLQVQEYPPRPEHV